MTEEIEVPEGTATTNVYVVEYDEELWFGLTENVQNYCKQFWINKATPLGVEEVALRLRPDPLFPTFGKEKPYIEWRHKFPKENGGEWVSTCKVTLNTNDHRDRLDGEGQETMRSYFSTYPKSTKFVVRNLNYKILWEHTT